MPPTRQPSASPIEVRTYAGATQAASGQAFAADAASAATRGYRVISQAWEGPVLTVTYQRDPTPPTRAATSSRPVLVAQTPPPLAWFGVVIGGAVMVVGPFLPWITTGFGFGSLSVSGVELQQLPITVWAIVAAGIVVALCGFGARVFSDAWILSLLASAGVGIAWLIDYNEVNVRLQGSPRATASLGFGLWVILAGAVIAGIASLGAHRPVAREP